MPEQINPEKIFTVLADNLPENLLQNLFPEHSPQDVRTIIRAAGASVTTKPGKQPAVDEKPRERSQGRLPFILAGADTCSLYTDGASRGNPGDAGAGIVLLDEDGSELLARSFYLGKCTNNSAEYQALIAGLENALEAGCKTLNIFLDSQLIVRQVQGLYKVKHEQLKPLYNQTRDLLAKLHSWEISHIPREKNFRADELANRGIDDDYAARGRM